MTEVISTHEQHGCKICHNILPENEGDICVGCYKKFFKDDTLTLKNTSKLLTLSVATLKMLEKDEILTPFRNGAGSRVYKRSKVIEYLTKKQIAGKPMKPAQNSVVSLIQLDLSERGENINGRCTRCLDNPMIRMGYCSECLEDLISRSQAAKILNVPSQHIDRIVENHPENLRFLPYSSQVRLSKEEVIAFSKIGFDRKTAVKPLWSYHFTRCRTCESTEHQHYGGGYCINCYPDTTEAAVLEGFIDGENLSEVAARLGFSRERARQFFEKAIRIEAERTDADNMDVVAKEFKDHLKITNKQNRSKLKFKAYVDDNYQTIIKKITTDNILSVSSFLKEFKLPSSAIYIIENDYPEVLEIIAKNEKRWAWHYDQCRMCGTTEKKHKVYGFCEECYWKSDEWKARQNKYRENNLDKLREQQRQYSVEYVKRPEVIERMKQKHNKYKYDGNRDLALENANHQCEECGISQADHIAKYGKELHVYRVDGNPKNNNIENLMTLCMSCSVKRTRAKQLLEK